MKTVLITGGARGIGYGIAQKFAQEGYRTILFGQSPYEKVKDAVEALPNATYVQGNLANREDRLRLADAAGAVDVLVNNAGVAPRVRADMLEMTEEDYDFVMDINLKGAFFLTQAIAKRMIASQKQGIIINVSSMSAYVSSTNRAQYCISKAGLSMSTTLFADRLAEHGIGVYEVRPGITKTDMTSGVSAKYDKLIFEDGILPTRRWGTPEDVAGVAFALASGVFAYATGQVINVDGGFHIRRL